MRIIARPVIGCGLLAAAALYSASAGAVIIQLNDPADFGPGIITNDFETVKDTAAVTFDPTASLINANAAAGGVTPSGVQGLIESRVDEPLVALLSSPATEVGFWFGNDDFGLVFDAILEVFDAGNVSLGLVTVQSNANDFADQFIGLRSTDPFTRAEIRYQRPEAQNLTIYIDDFSVNVAGQAAPEPGTAVLLGLGVLGLALRMRRREAA